MKKPSKKKIIAILIIIILLIALFPDVQSDNNIDKPSPDYGIYDALEEVQDEKNSKINSPEVLNATESRFDNITITSGEEKYDPKSGREIVTPDIPVPGMLNIYDEMKEWDKTYNNEIRDWILPEPFGKGTPANYYIYSRYVTNTSITERWTNASLRPTIVYPEPNIDRWWGVDVDNVTGDDIEVFFDPVVDETIWDWQPGDWVSRAIQLLADQTLEVGIIVRYDIHKLDDAPFNSPDFKNLEVYVAKSMSYSGMNFILFIGLNFSNMVTWMNCSVEVNTVQFERINILETLTQAITQGYISFDLGDMVNLSGPYYLRWNSGQEDLSSFSLEVAAARIEINGDDSDPYKFLNRSWVDIDFEESGYYDKVPSWAELMVDADDELSSFNKITWDAEHVCNAHIKFFDSQENVTYAEIEINELPRDVDISMFVEETGDQNITIIEYSAEDVVNYFNVQHYQFFKTSYENITAAKIASGEVEYVNLFLNISGLPEKLYLKGIFYLEEIEELPSISVGFGVIAQLINSIAHRVISRFTRIAKTFSSVPYRLLSIAEEGSFATIDTYYPQTHDDIDEIEFILTSGDYATTEGNFFAFYNNTRSSKYPIAQISLSGRITNVRYFNASFEEDVVAEIEMMNNQRFRAIYADDINNLNAEMNISNVPGSIKIRKSAADIDYDGGGRTIDEVKFISDYQGSYMDFRVTNLADIIHVEYEEDRTFVSTDSDQKSIGEVEFLVTTGPIFRMNGNHLLLRQESNYSLLSGGIRDVSKLEYISGEDGKLDIFFTQENCINVSLLDNRSEKIMADLIIDPIPRELSVNLSGLFSTGVGNISLPRLDTTGVLGLAHIIFGIAALGNEILNVVDQATQDALQNVGNIIENLSFSYSTTTHVTLIGKILRGDSYSLGDVDWVHGISAVQETSGQKTSMAAKLYLSGLPTEAGIATKVQGDKIFLDFHLRDYMPEHDWLCIDVRGLQDRDVMLYLNDLKQGMNLDLKIDLFVSLNTIPQKGMGSIHMDSDKGIGVLYGKMRQTVPDLAISEIFLSSVPKTLDCAFNLGGNISLIYEAHNEIDYIFIKNTRPRDGEFHDLYMILHQVPRQLEISVFPSIDYDMDASILQTLPTLTLSSSGSALDAFIFADGKGIGQVGIVEMQVVNAPGTLNGKFSNNKYQITSSGVEYLWIHVMELPIMEGHKTKSIEIVGKDILSFDINLDNLFGNYPIIGIEDAKGGEVQLVVDHEMNEDKLGLALIDFKFVNGLPSSPSILINGGAVDLEKGSSHVIVPAPILTLYLSIFS